MRPIFYATVGLLLTIEVCSAASWEGTDDFASGISSGKWYTNQFPDGTSLRSGQMQVVGVNGHASYLVSGSTTSEQQATLFWKGFPAATNDWMAEVVGHNSASYLGSGDSQFQFNLFDMSSVTAGSPRWYALHMGRVGGFHTDWGADQGETAPAPSANFGLRIIYRSSAKTLEAWYDPYGTGTGWTQLETVTLDQPFPTMATNGLFGIGIFANCYYGPIAEGQLYADNFRLVSLAPTPIRLLDAVKLPSGAFQFSFTNTPNASFTVLGSTNLALQLGSWTVLGTPIEFAPGQFRFSDPSATNGVKRFYRVRWP